MYHVKASEVLRLEQDLLYIASRLPFVHSFAMHTLDPIDVDYTPLGKLIVVTARVPLSESITAADYQHRLPFYHEQYSLVYSSFAHERLREHDEEFILYHVSYQVVRREDEETPPA